MTRIVKSQARVTFIAPHALTPSMHKLCFSSLVLNGTIICAIKPKKKKGRRMRRKKRKSGMGWSHHSQRQDDKEVLE